MKYNIGDAIMYPKQGLGVIKEVTNRMFKGVKTDYYNIYFDTTEMSMLVPFGLAESKGVRPVVSMIDAQRTIDNLGELFYKMKTLWNIRYEQNKELLNTGSFRDAGSVVVVLSIKEFHDMGTLPVLEDRLFMKARHLFIDELACALGLSYDDAQHLLNEKLREVRFVGNNT